MNTTLFTETTTADYRNYHGGYFKVLISPDQTGGAFSMVDMTVPRGSEPPMHVHLREDEAFYVLEGEIDYTIGSEVIKAKAGDAVFAPREIPHRFALQTPGARILITFTPGEFSGFFIDQSSPVTGALKLTPPQGPPVAEAIEAMAKLLAGKYGVLLV